MHFPIIATVLNVDKVSFCEPSMSLIQDKRSGNIQVSNP